MYVTNLTGEQLIYEISKRQQVHEIPTSFAGDVNRRRSPRLLTMYEPVSCRITTPNGEKLKSAFVNFSDSGALLKGPLQVGIDQSIEIFVSFEDSKETFALKGRIVRIQSGDLGVEFYEES